MTHLAAGPEKEAQAQPGSARTTGPKVAEPSRGSQQPPASLTAYLDYVNRFVDVFESGQRLPIGASARLQAKPRISQHHVVLCSPHPDDEALVGGLPLRLLLQGQATVLNCAITLGSNRAERKRRISELYSSCAVLGFDLFVPNHPHGFDEIETDLREKRKQNWSRNVDCLAERFDSEAPDLVVLPHADDYHPTHIGTRCLVLDALSVHVERARRAAVMLAETEFWHPMRDPNLLLGLSPAVVARLLAATAEHRGEVERNPYHLTLPARLMDNVRRGSEVLGRFGGKAGSFLFGELYRFSLMKSTGEINALPAQIIPPEQRVALECLRPD